MSKSSSNSWTSITHCRKLYFEAFVGNCSVDRLALFKGSLCSKYLFTCAKMPMQLFLIDLFPPSSRRTLPFRFRSFSLLPSLLKISPRRPPQLLHLVNLLLLCLCLRIL